MPEGPSIVILKEAVQPFIGKKVLHAHGRAGIDMQRLTGKKITDFKSWGKQFLICFPDCTVRVHFMLYGTYLINAAKDITPGLGLEFSKGVLNFYTAAANIRIIEVPLDEVYDWSADVMSLQWDPAAAIAKLKAAPDMLVCDALLDQQIFAGVGNIIKNEVLFRIRVHPASRIGSLPAAKLKALVKEASNYSFDFLRWKKENVLKRHWLAHTRQVCPRCNIPLLMEYMGKTKRRTFFCNNCQQLYA